MIASSTLSRTVSFGKRLVTWNVRAMPSAVRRCSPTRDSSPPAGPVRSRRQYAGDDVEQRRLACPVRADDRFAVAGKDADIDVLDRAQSAEAPGQALQLENRLRFAHSQCLQGGKSRLYTGCFRNSPFPNFQNWLTSG